MCNDDTLGDANLHKSPQSTYELDKLDINFRQRLQNSIKHSTSLTSFWKATFERTPKIATGSIYYNIFVINSTVVSKSTVRTHLTCSTRENIESWVTCERGGVDFCWRRFEEPRVKNAGYSVRRVCVGLGSNASKFDVVTTDVLHQRQLIILCTTMTSLLVEPPANSPMS